MWAYFPKNFFLQSISYAAYAAYGFSDVALGDWNPLCSAKTYILVYECILRYDIDQTMIRGPNDDMDLSLKVRFLSNYSKLLVDIFYV